MLIEIIAFMCIGAFSGIAAGLLGIGGGLIIVPFSLIVFDYLANNSAIVIPFSSQVHIAIATSLASIIFTSLSAIYSQQKKGAIDWLLFLQLAPGIILGAFCGAWMASLIPREPLLFLFASFVSLVAIKMWLGWSPQRMASLPDSSGMNFVATIIGIISAIIGIGGGTMTVPFLTRAKVPIQRAIAISSALGLPIAISGSLGFYWRSSSSNLDLDVQSLMCGYIYLPAFFSIISLSIITTRFGVYLSHRLSKQTLSKVFSVLLMILAIKLYCDVV